MTMWYGFKEKIEASRKAPVREALDEVVYWPIPEDEIEKFHSISPEGYMTQKVSEAKLEEVKRSVKARRTMTTEEFQKLVALRSDQVNSAISALTVLNVPEIREFFGFNKPEREFFFTHGYLEQIRDSLRDSRDVLWRYEHVMRDGVNRQGIAKGMGLTGWSKMEKSETMMDMMLWYAKVYVGYFREWAGWTHVPLDHMDAIRDAVADEWLSRKGEPGTGEPVAVIWLPDDTPQITKDYYARLGLVNGFPVIRS